MADTEFADFSAIGEAIAGTDRIYVWNTSAGDPNRDTYALLTEVDTYLSTSLTSLTNLVTTGTITTGTWASTINLLTASLTGTAVEFNAACSDKTFAFTDEATLSSLTTVGALASGSLASGFGASTLTGSLTIEQDGATASSLVLQEGSGAGTDTITLKSPALTLGSIELILPQTVGIDGHVLTSAGDGSMNFEAVEVTLAGINAFTTLNTFTSSAFVHIITTSVATAVTQTALILKHLTTGLAVDDFGVDIEFNVDDSDTTSKTIGRLGYVLTNGAVDSGKFFLQTASADTLANALTIDYDGTVDWVKGGNHDFQGGNLLGATAIELGDAADTTLSRAGAGLLAVEGDTVAMLATANIFAADQTLNDNVNLTLGTGGDADIFYDATNLVISPAVAGTGDVDINGGSVAVDATERIYLGGLAGDTYIEETSANPDTVTVNTGAAVGLRVVEGTGDATEANVVCGAANVLLAAATDGFLYIPYSSDGAFAGTPTAYTGKSALGYDQTNDNLMVYDVGEAGWKNVGTSGSQTPWASDIDIATYGLVDTNGNEMLEFGTTASAITYVTITNAITGTAGPIISSAGETNVDLQLSPAGTGAVNVNSSKITNLTAGATTGDAVEYDQWQATVQAFNNSPTAGDYFHCLSTGPNLFQFKTLDIVDDTTPQLGAMLDVNTFGLGDGTLELLLFVETGSAVNELTITNAATAGSPSLTATGDDANIDLLLDGKGTGTVKTASSNLDITGNIIVSGTVDGIDIATDVAANTAKLTCDATNVAAAGGVLDTGNETIAGVKTFSSDPLIPDEVYGVGWNGSLEPPTKNAVYDKIETLGGGGDVTKVGTPANTELGIWTGDGTLGKDEDQASGSALTFDGETLVVKSDAAGGNPATLYLKTGDTSIVSADDQIGRILFQAPDEVEGGNAILAVGQILCSSEETFDATHNKTKIHIQTSDDGAAADRVVINSDGLTLGTGTSSPPTGNLVFGTNQRIFATTSNMTFDVATGDGYTFRVGDSPSSYMNLTSSGLVMVNSADLAVEAGNQIFLDGLGGVTLIEQTSADPDILTVQVAGQKGLRIQEGTADQTEVNVVVGADNQLSTSAVAGFFHVPNCAGIPAGTPETTYTGKTPMVYDDTNNKPYFWNGAAWATPSTAPSPPLELTQFPIPCTMEVPEGTVAYPDIHALATTGNTKVSGFVLPDGATAGIINFKCVVPPNLVSGGDMKIRVRYMTIDYASGTTVAFSVSTKGFSAGDLLDAALTADSTNEEDTPSTTVEDVNVYEVHLNTDPTVNETLLGQLKRDPTVTGGPPDDDFAGDILVIGIELLCDLEPA